MPMKAGTPDNLADNLAACARGRRHAGRTAAARRRRRRACASIARPVPVCADESAHDRASLAALVGKYDAVNIKLDKTGGLTEALAHGGTKPSGSASRSWPAAWSRPRCRWRRRMLIAQTARVVDLDGPLLLARDRPDGLRYDGSLVYPPDHSLWG